MASLTPASLVRILRQPRLDMCVAPIRDPRPPLDLWPRGQTTLACVSPCGGRTAKQFLVYTKDNSVQTKKLFFVNSFKTSYCPWATESFSKHVIFKRGSIAESRCIYMKGKYSIWNILTLDSPLPLVGFHTVPLRMKRLVLIQCAFLHLKTQTIQTADARLPDTAAFLLWLFKLLRYYMTAISPDIYV